jgi:hypothetical protein
MYLAHVGKGSDHMIKEKKYYRINREGYKKMVIF